jgi:hypothetical protein
MGFMVVCSIHKYIYLSKDSVIGKKGRHRVTRCVFFLFSAARILICLFKLIAVARRQHGGLCQPVWSTVSSLISHIKSAPLDERHSCVQYAQVHIPFLIRTVG